RDERDLRCGGGAAAKEHPDVALHLARRVAADMDMPGRKRLTVCERGDQHAPPAGVEPPAVIAALDLVAVEAASGEPHAAMRAEVAQRKGHTARVAANQDRL